MKMDDKPTESQTHRVDVVFEVNKNLKNLQNPQVGVLLDGKSRDKKRDFFTREDLSKLEDVQLTDLSHDFDEAQLKRWSLDDYEELKENELNHSPYYSQCFADSTENLYRETSLPFNLRKLSISTDQGEGIYLKPEVSSRHKVLDLNESGSFCDEPSFGNLQRSFDKASEETVELSKVNFRNEVEGQIDGIDITFQEDLLEPKARLFRIFSKRNYRKRPKFPKVKKNKNKKEDIKTIDEGFYKTFGDDSNALGSKLSLDSLGIDRLYNTSESAGGTSTAGSSVGSEYFENKVLSLEDDVVENYSEGLIVTADRKIVSYRVGLVVGDKMKIEGPQDKDNESEKVYGQDTVKSDSNGLDCSQEISTDIVDSKIEDIQPQVHLNTAIDGEEQEVKDRNNLNFELLNSSDSSVDQDEFNKYLNSTLKKKETGSLFGAADELLNSTSFPLKEETEAEEINLIEAKSRGRSIKDKITKSSPTEVDGTLTNLTDKILSDSVYPPVHAVMMEEKGEFDKFEWETNKPRGFLSPEASGGYVPDVKSPLTPEDKTHTVEVISSRSKQMPLFDEFKGKEEAEIPSIMERSFSWETEKPKVLNVLHRTQSEGTEAAVTPEKTPESQKLPSLSEQSVFRVLSQKEAIIGLPSEVTLEVKDIQRDLRLDELNILPDADSVRLVDRRSVVSYSNRLKRLKLRFIPLEAGPCSLKVASKTGVFADEIISVEADGNNPLLSFSEGEEFPVNVACSLVEPTVYVSYSHHISKFNHEGEFLRNIVHDKKVYFNDFAVDESSYIAVCVSSWDEEAKKKRTNQEVRLYDPFGVLQWSVATPSSDSVCRVTFDWHGNVLFSTKQHLSRCSRLTGELDISHPIPGLEMVNRIAASPRGELLVLDGVSRKLHILDNTLNFLRVIELQQANGEQEESEELPEEFGYSGLCIDKVGNIVVSDCRRETVDFYRPDGIRLGWLESEWDPIRWPLSVSVSRSGFLFIVDHRNGCIKKFKYLT